MLHFDVRQGGEATRAPVHHAGTAIDQSFLEEDDKRMADGARTLVIHGEACSGPVAARSQTLELHEDRIAGLLPPLPHPLKELLPAQGKTGLLFRTKQFFNHILSGDPAMVCSGEANGCPAAFGTKGP